MDDERETAETLVVNPLVVLQETAAGAVLMDVASGDCFELNQIGTEIWSRLARQERVPAIVTALAARYEVASAALEKDVGGLVSQLLQHGLLTRPRR
jgi:hypothetical protein